VPRSNKAWQQAYRALEHRNAKNRCADDKIIPKFPQAIQDFANAFVTMQIKRHLADYDPFVTLYKSEVRQDLAEAKDVISRFVRVSARNRRAFAAHVLLAKRN
jgi:hypothetical protein